ARVCRTRRSERRSWRCIGRWTASWRAAARCYGRGGSKLRRSGSRAKAWRGSRPVGWADFTRFPVRDRGGWGRLRGGASGRRRAGVTLTMGEDDLDERLSALAETIERRAKARPSPAVAIVKAPNIERECEEIARRIVEQAAAGRPFREIGVIVRSEGAYKPIL